MPDRRPPGRFRDASLAAGTTAGQGAALAASASSLVSEIGRGRGYGREATGERRTVGPMRLLAACLALATGLVACGLAPVALAACGGANMLDVLADTDQAAHAAIVARAEATPNAEGRFWRIERHATSSGSAPSHLFGTFHTDQAVATVSPAVWQALDGARIALFELGAAEQDAMQARLAGDPAFAFDEAAPPLNRRLSPAGLATVARALAARGIPLDHAQQMRPWMLFSLLALPACHLEALAAGATPLDDAMAARATAGGIPHAGLETYEAALAAFGRIAPDRLLAVLVETSALGEREEDIFRTNLDLYAAGRLAMIDAFGRWLSTRPPSGPGSAALYDEVKAELVDTRNRAWLDPLEAELAEGGAFVAVGALHLPGSAGLIELLRARGWVLTRLD